jgi:hypothetical protein
VSNWSWQSLEMLTANRGVFMKRNATPTRLMAAGFATESAALLIGGAPGHHHISPVDSRIGHDPLKGLDAAQIPVLVEAHERHVGEQRPVVSNRRFTTIGESCAIS